MSRRTSCALVKVLKNKNDLIYLGGCEKRKTWTWCVKNMLNSWHCRASTPPPPLSSLIHLLWKSACWIQSSLNDLPVSASPNSSGCCLWLTTENPAQRFQRCSHRYHRLLLDKLMLVGHLQVPELTERIQTAESTLICTGLSSSLWTLDTSLLTLTAVAHRVHSLHPVWTMRADQFLQLVWPSAGQAGACSRQTTSFEVNFKLCLKLTSASDN